MKTLYLVRHAKAVREEESLSDYERPLRNKGMRSIHGVIKKLKEKNTQPDILYSSHAMRAIQTATLIFRGLELPQEAFSLCPSLFEGPLSDYVSVMRSIPEKCRSAMIIGHNPAITRWTAKSSANRQKTQSLGWQQELPLQRINPLPLVADLLEKNSRYSESVI